MQVILGVFSLFLLSSCGRIEARIEANDGFQAYQKKDYLSAIAHYEAALKDSPDDFTVIRNLGFAHLSAAREAKSSEETKHHNDEAIQHLFRLAKEYPEDKELSALLVDTWTQADRLGEAALYYHEYVTRLPNDPEAWRVLGQIEVRRGNYPAALETFEKRLALVPNDIQITAGKAILCWEWLRSGGLESNEKAVQIATLGLEAALRADQQDPKHPTALVYAGLLLRQRASHQQDPKESQKDLLEAQKVLERVKARNKGA